MTEWEINRLVELLLTPPAIVVLLGLLVLLIARIRPRFFARVLFVAIFLLWLAGTPWFSFVLLDHLQDRYPPLYQIPDDADVVVVLGGGRNRGENEFGGDVMPAAFALERVRYAGYLARKAGLPVIASGGLVDNAGTAEATLAGEILRNEQGVVTVWEEDRSTTTLENARFTRKIMREKGLKRPLIVTQYWHMPRAMDVFQSEGLEAYAAPTARLTPSALEREAWQWLPQARNLFYTSIALHEIIGGIWYQRRLQAGNQN